jgi:hypothetical protein
MKTRGPELAIDTFVNVLPKETTKEKLLPDQTAQQSSSSATLDSPEEKEFPPPLPSLLPPSLANIDQGSEAPILESKNTQIPSSTEDVLIMLPANYDTLESDSDSEETKKDGLLATQRRPFCSDAEKPGIIYFLLDADGCVFRGFCFKPDKVIDINESLFVHMLTIMAENPNAEVWVGIGSNRQSRFYDEAISSNRNQPTFRAIIVCIAEELQKRAKRVVSVDHYLLCYTFNDIPNGTQLKDIGVEQDCFKDHSKLLIHYAFSHRLASYAESKKIDKSAIYFYDNEQEMLNTPEVFFGFNPEFLSSGIKIHPYPYDGTIGAPKPIVSGSGPTDHDYHAGVKMLCQLAGVPAKVWRDSSSKDYGFNWNVLQRLSRVYDLRSQFVRRRSSSASSSENEVNQSQEQKVTPAEKAEKWNNDKSVSTQTAGKFKPPVISLPATSEENNVSNKVSPVLP